MIVGVNSTEARGRHSNAALIDLSKLIKNCDRVVQATVSRVIEVPRKQPRNAQFRPRASGTSGSPGTDDPTIRVLELHVDASLWSDPSINRLYVLDAKSYERRPAGPDIQIGARGIWFLENWRTSWVEDKATRSDLEELAGPLGIQSIAFSGAGFFALTENIEHPEVLVPFTLDGTPPAEYAGHAVMSHERVVLDTFKRELRTAVSANTPSVEARLVSNGPSVPGVSVDRFGHCHFESVEQQPAKRDIGEAGIREIMRVAKEQHFFELPRTVGRSLGPDSTMGVLMIRSEQGAHEIRIEGPPGSSAGEQDEHTRASAVWKLIPVLGAREITGH
jgi:hypothetical protein